MISSYFYPIKFNKPTQFYEEYFIK